MCRAALAQKQRLASLAPGDRAALQILGDVGADAAVVRPSPPGCPEQPSARLGLLRRLLWLGLPRRLFWPAYVDMQRAKA